MTDWNDILTNDIDAFMELGQEPIVFKPKGGSERSMNAIVDRGQNQTNPTIGLRANLTIIVRNNATTGIETTELDPGGSKFQVAAKEGGTPKWFENITLVKQDAGALTIELR